MAAALNYTKHCRSWNLEDSVDNSDVERLFEPESVKYTKPVRCVKYCSLYASICVFFALFLLGLLVGFYARDDQNVQQQCTLRKDGLNKEKLQAVHNNIVYVMSGNKIKEYVRVLNSLDPDEMLNHAVSHLDPNGLYRQLSSLYSKKLDTWGDDYRTAKLVEKEFREFGFSHVDVEEHDVVVTSPDPTRPNRLEVLYPDGSTVYNISYNGQGEHSYKDNELSPFMVITAAGNAEGPLVYGKYGTPADFLSIQAGNVSMQGAVILLKIGKISVSEKLRRAKEYGVVAVLLYCAEEHYHDNRCQSIEVVSWPDFDAQNNDVIQCLPVQTVSLEVAARLLRTINQTDTSLSEEHLSGDEGDKPGKRNLTLSVRLQINNTPVTRKVYNVMGTITGSEEPDRLVLVGAGRQNLPSSSAQDRVSSTAMLMELGRSLTYIRDVEGWEPRRTIKLVSWGGHALSKSGLLYHIKENYETLRSDAVSYIDLDIQTNTSDVMKYFASPGLEKTVHLAASMVEDPANPEMSLTDSWQQYEQHPSVHSDRYGQLPIMHQFGIPSSVITALQVPNKFDGREITQHYKFHLASARVVSHVVLELADFPLLPMHMDIFIELVKQLVNSSIQYMKQIVSQTTFVSLQADLNHLAEAGQKFPDRSSEECSISLKMREMNDILMRLDRTFFHTVAYNRSQKSRLQYLLHQDAEAGTLYVFSEAFRTYRISGNLEPVIHVFDILQRSVQELTSSLAIYHRR